MPACRILLVSLNVAALFAWTDARAATFSVSPIRIHLAPRTTSALLTVRNTSPSTLRFQLNAYAWRETAAGKTELSATDAIVFFPTMMSVKPGEQRKVRVGTVKRADAKQERTYRILVQELPPPRKADRKGKPGEVQVLTRMSIPVFVAPRRPAAKAQIEGVKVDAGQVRFRVRNRGNVHTMLEMSKVTALDALGMRLFSKEIKGWYLLAASVRDYEVTVPKALCAKVRAVEVEAKIARAKPERTRIEVPARGACDAR